MTDGLESLAGTASKAYEARLQQVYPEGLVRFPPLRTVLPPSFMTWWSERLCKFQSRPTDVWMVSFPKTGTTWLQEMVWCIANDVDLDAAKKATLDKRFPFIEFAPVYRDTIRLSLGKELLQDFPDFIDILESSTDATRFIKTHLPLSMLPENLLATGSKVIYPIRDPRDACVSYYYHKRIYGAYEGTFAEFFGAFLEDGVVYSPFWTHLFDMWNQRHNPNVLLVRYADMKRDLDQVISTVSQFLGSSLSPDQIIKLKSHLSFENMRNNDAVNKNDGTNGVWTILKGTKPDVSFMRRGTVGDWKNHFDDDMAKTFRKWVDSSGAQPDLIEYLFSDSPY